MERVKKVLNVVLILVGVCLIVVCCDLVLNKAFKTSLADIDETDRAAVEELCGIIEEFDPKYGSDYVWTENFNMRQCSFVITRQLGLVRGRTYVVNMKVSKDMFAQKIKMPDEYSDISVYRLSYFSPAVLTCVSKEEPFFARFRGTRVLCASFDKPTVTMNGSGSLEETEIKMSFSDSVESVDTPQPSEIDCFEIDRENIALLGLEYRIIDDMLNASSPEQLNELIAEYVTVRDYHDEKFPKFARTRENIELTEGTAQYVFYSVSGLIGHDLTYFNKETSDTITFYSAYYYLCTGRYNSDIREFLDKTGHDYTGAALCRIINDNELAKNWQSKLNGEQGDRFVSQYTLIKRYARRECGEFADKTLDEIKATYNYDEIDSMAQTLCGAMG